MKTGNRYGSTPFWTGLVTALVSYFPVKLVLVLAFWSRRPSGSITELFRADGVSGAYGVHFFLLVACLVPVLNFVRRTRRGTDEASLGWGQGALNAIGDTLGQCLFIALMFALWAALIGFLNKPSLSGLVGGLTGIGIFGLFLAVYAFPGFLFANLLRVPMLHIGSPLCRFMLGVLGLFGLLSLSMNAVHAMEISHVKLGGYLVYTMCMLSMITYLATVAGVRAGLWSDAD